MNRHSITACRITAGLAWLVFGRALAQPAHFIPVNEDGLDIDYAINSESRPITRVEIWYTPDEGQSWKLFGIDEDLRPPARFDSPGDGLFGLFLVVVNRTGPSSQPPTPRTEPHVWVYVDTNPPVVQLHAARAATGAGGRTVQLKWSAVDDHFKARPISLEYRRLSDEAWRTADIGALANTGRYDWPVPSELIGVLEVRLVASDLGGHRVTSEVLAVDVSDDRDHADVVPVAAAITANPAGAQTDRTTRSATNASHLSTAHVARLYAEAIAHRSAGDEQEAIRVLREVVRRDPQWARAFADLGELLYRVGDTDEALSAFKIAATQQPGLRSAHRGAALVYTKRRDYEHATSHLRTILRYRPNDAEIWMHLGDVAIYRGDEALARECYTRAMQTDPSATAVIENATQRLSLMDEVSRRYREDESR